MTDRVEQYLGSRKKNPKQREFFDERAGIWDEISVHDAEKVAYIADLLDLEDGMDVLDVGTGTGVMIPYYLERMDGGKVTAIDYSPAMIEVAKRKYPESERLAYRAMDLYDLDGTQEYDRVVCYSCFPHFPDPMGALRVLSKQLKPYGTLCIAHSSSRDYINHVHECGGREICNDFLPEIDIMIEMFEQAGLDPVFSRDDSEYYIVIGRRRRRPGIMQA